MLPTCEFTNWYHSKCGYQFVNLQIRKHWKYCIVCLLSWMYVYSRVSYRASIDIRDWPMIFCPCEFSLWWRVTNIVLLQHGHHSSFICYMLRFFLHNFQWFPWIPRFPMYCMHAALCNIPPHHPPKNTHLDAIAPSILKACRAQSIIHSHRMSNLFLICHTHRRKPALQGRADTPI